MIGQGQSAENGSVVNDNRGWTQDEDRPRPTTEKVPPHQAIEIINLMAPLSPPDKGDVPYTFFRLP